MADETNRQHWDGLGARYSQNWSGAAQQSLSEKETSFVIGHVPRGPDQTVLDVGIGNGRILEALVSLEQVDAVYGVDISPEMVHFCRKKFENSPRVRGLAVLDVAREPLSFPPLNFVSAIRVLKYSRDWWHVVEKLLAQLVPRGVLVFSMPNATSVKRFSRPYDIEYFKTTQKELRRRFDRANGELLGVTGFAKVPDVAYRSCRRPALASSLVMLEGGLDRAIGPATLSRELFVAARRTS